MPWAPERPCSEEGYPAFAVPPRQPLPASGLCPCLDTSSSLAIPSPQPHSNLCSAAVDAFPRQNSWELCKGQVPGASQCLPTATDHSPALSSRNIMQSIIRISLHNFTFSGSHNFKQEQAGEINFYGIFDLTQYIQNSIISTSNSIKQLSMNSRTVFLQPQNPVCVLDLRCIWIQTSNFFIRNPYSVFGFHKMYC